MIRQFVPLRELEVYKLARELADLGWSIYENLSWQDKKVMGDQFIESTDSVGANIAEGYSRYHYLDKIKFYYNSRASLAECSEHWIELLNERGKIEANLFTQYKEIAKTLSVKLNNFITATYRSKNANETNTKNK